MPGALAWGSGGEIHSTPSAVAHTAFWRAMLRKPHHRRCLPEWRRRAWAADSDQQAHKLQAFRMPPPTDLRAKYQKALGAPAKQLWIAAVFARSGGKQGCPIVGGSLAGGLATSGERGN